MSTTDQPQVFVGREQVIDRLLAAVEDNSRLRVDRVSGSLGLGKSALLRQVRDRAAARCSEAAVHLVDLAEFDPGYARHGGESLTFGQAQKNFDQLKRLAGALSRCTSPARARRVSAAATTAWQQVRAVRAPELHVSQHVEVGQSGTLSHSPPSITVSSDPRALESHQVAAILQAGLDLTDALARCLNETAERRPVVILLDEVDRVAGQQVGRWLARVVEHLDRGLVILAQEPGSGLDLPPGLGDVVRLLPLSVEEVQEFLDRRLGVLGATADLARLVHRCSGGLPVAVEILADLVADPEIRLREPDLERRLVRMPADPEGRMAGVVIEIVERLEGRTLGRALKAASIPEECDAALLAALLAGDGTPDGVDVGRLMAELGTFSFTREFRSPADRRDYVAVHPFIRHAISERMRRHETAEHGRLHEVAARHQFDKLTSARGYGEMFFYERPAQQARLRCWLYHMAHSDEPRSALLESAMIFFDAFWWWGSYVQFGLCETLAEDFRAIALETGNQDWADFADAVHRFMQTYPYRATLRQDFERNYPDAPWDDVRDVLLEIEEICDVVDVGSDAPELDRHVRALLQTFLAHSHRFQPAGRQGRAAACYEEAAGLLEGLEEWWDLAWVTFELADLALELGERAEARAGAAEAARLLKAHPDKEPDEEIIANLHRLWADLAWDEGRPDDAALEYGAAVLHAYLFHAVGGPPDDYTMQFYFDIRGRALERLLDRLVSAGRAAADRFAELMLEAFPGASRPQASPDALWAAYESADVAGLAEVLFPRGPELDELDRRSSPFMRELRRLRDEVTTPPFKGLLDG
jgi:hypothetical protein